MRARCAHGSGNTPKVCSTEFFSNIMVYVFSLFLRYGVCLTMSHHQSHPGLVSCISLRSLVAVGFRSMMNLRTRIS